jgi:phosphate transport system permease protein
VDFLTSFPSRIIPANSGIQSAIYGTLWTDGDLRGDRRAARDRDRRLPRGVSRPQEVVEPLIEVNIQNLAAVPVGRLRDPRPRVHRPRPAVAGPHPPGGGITLSLLVLPGGDHRRARGDPRGAALDPRGLAGARRDAVADDLEAGPAGSIAGIATGVILALSRAIGETAPLLIIGAAVSPRFNPSGLFDSFTALPIQIFSWTTDANREFVSAAAGAILVLMLILVLMNSIAIYLRNRYEQKW